MCADARDAPILLYARAVPPFLVPDAHVPPLQAYHQE